MTHELKRGSRCAIFAPLVFALVPLIGCAAGIGDSAARIAGQIVDELGQAHDGCRIELLHESSETTLDYRVVGSRFLTTFVLPIRPEMYRLRVSCPGSVETFINKPLLLGELKKTYDIPVDLGTLVLKRRQ